MCFCLMTYAQVKPQMKTSGEKVMKKVDYKHSNEGFIYGKLDYKPAKLKSKSQGLTREGIVLVLRDVSSKKILDVTQTDEKGGFKFRKMKPSKRQVELLWELPSQKWPPRDEWGCVVGFKQLPYDYAEPLQLMEVCDEDINFTYRIQTSYCICVTDPCPCSEDPFQQWLKDQW